MTTKTGKVNFFFVLSWTLMGLGMLGMVVALATSYWRGENEIHEGIFQKCTEQQCENVTFFSGKDSKLDLVRILMLIGILYTALGTFLGLFSIGPPSAVTILRVLSFIHWSTALALYTVFFGNMTFLWGFYICWSGLSLFCVGLIIMAILTLCKQRHEMPDLPLEESEDEDDNRKH